MLIAKNDEEKRNRLWRVTTIVSTAVILAIAAFFITRMFMDNPLSGVWEYEDSDVTLTFGKNDSASIQGAGLLEETSVTVHLTYIIDKKNKTVTIKEDRKELQRVADESEGVYTVEDVGNIIDIFTETFDYNIEGKQLTLSDREYGSYLIFHEK